VDICFFYIWFLLAIRDINNTFVANYKHEM
jgi:hypothetical protein